MVDRDVRRRFRTGERDAVSAVYHAYGRLVYAVAYRLLSDRSLAEEATQQTFVKAWRGAESFDENREMTPWLVAIAKRTAIDIHRREALRSATPIDSIPEGAPALVTRAAAPEDIYDVWEVRSAVATLPAEEQEVVRLQHFEGLTHTEIAGRLGVAVGTVKSRSFRAHKRLAAALGHLRR